MAISKETKEKWNRWHPIARSIAQRMISREEPDLTDEELESIEADLAALYDKAELRNAVRDVLFLAAALEHEGATQIARRLFALVEAKDVIGALDRINHVRAVDRAELVASNAKRFAAFSRSAPPARTSSDRGTPAPRGLRVRDFMPLLA